MGARFKNDIFISYAHLDNQPIIQGEQGWISDFDYTLKVFLEQLLGEQFSIWRDPKLRGNDDLNGTILDVLQNVALFISVLSPRYVKSEWCMKELREFCRAAEQTGGVRVANKARIFKVVKTPVEPPDEYPQEMQDLTGYEFYKLDQATGKPMVFDKKIFGPNAEQYFLQKLLDIAHDIKDILKTLKNYKETEKHTEITVYLAETTSDLKNERDKIKRELQQRHYRVLPERPLPLNNTEADFKTVVRKDLKLCTLSIHLIGEKYGVIPEGEENSIVDLQNELAAERNQEDPVFSRLIWMPIGLQVKEEVQQQFINYLQNNPGTQKGAEILQTSIEDLKTIVQDKLQISQQKSFKEKNIQEGSFRVYLIYDQQDIKSIEPLQDYLFKQNFEVLSPIFEGDQAEVRQYHQDNLCLCDATIIYYGNAKERWLQVQMGELRKAPGYGRSKPMLTKAVYVSLPETSHKKLFQTHESLVIKNYAAFSPDSVEPFIKLLR